MNRLDDIKALFQNQLEEMEKERQQMVRTRIENFFNRHKRVTFDDHDIPDGRKVAENPAKN